MPGFADSHLHLAEENIGGTYPDLDGAALLFSCAAERKDWKIQQEFSDPKIRCFYGIHPWYCGQWTVDAKDELKNILESDPGANVGEIGMDSRHPDPELQSAVFASQAMLAGEYGRTVNVHNRGFDGETVRILKKHGKGIRSVILHSFKGPSVKPYSGLNCYFSVNARMFGKSPEKVRDMLLSIPEDRLLFESDAPFVSGYFKDMGTFVETLAHLTGRTPEELVSVTLENAERALE